jgi:hypothetical protein
MGGNPPIPGYDLDETRVYLQFRNFKDILDKTLTGNSGYRRLSSHTVSLDYFRYMLPGIDFEISEESEYQSLDPEKVIGCSWRSYYPPANPDEIMQKLNAAPPHDIDRAAYSQIEDLPLYIAHEGQNRVELFRRHEQPINADVQRLFLTRKPVIVRNSTGNHWLATWMNEHGVQKFSTVPFPTIALPMYRLLGISIVPIRLPVDENDISESITASIESLTEAVALP